MGAMYSINDTGYECTTSRFLCESDSVRKHNFDSSLPLIYYLLVLYV